MAYGAPWAVSSGTPDLWEWGCCPEDDRGSGRGWMSNRYRRGRTICSRGCCSTEGRGAGKTAGGDEAEEEKTGGSASIWDEHPGRGSCRICPGIWLGDGTAVWQTEKYSWEVGYPSGSDW